MSKIDKISIALSKFLPENSSDKVASLLVQHPVKFKIVKPRKSKLGDFRVFKNQYTITVNGDLNPYSFLITTLHEIAHLKTYVQFKNKVKPHGVEWKKEFQDLLVPFYYENIFPEDLKDALISYINNPKASSCSDLNLMRALKAYDKNKKVLVENLAEGEQFQLNNFTFVKGKKARTRYKCKEVSTGKYYMVSGIAEIE